MNLETFISSVDNLVREWATEPNQLGELLPREQLKAIFNEVCEQAGASFGRSRPRSRQRHANARNVNHHRQKGKKMSHVEPEHSGPRTRGEPLRDNEGRSLKDIAAWEQTSLEADDPTPLKTYQQLHLEIEGARSGEDGTPQTPEELVDYIIKLYGDEFLKANIEIGRLRDLVRQSDKITVEIVGILPRVRDCLKRWAARYAASPHAKKNLAESRLLMQEVTELYEKLPHHGKD